MRPQWLATQFDQLKKGALAEGGFEELPGGGYRPDATAWAILALSTENVETKLLDSARTRLAAGQLEDGRVSISPDHPEVFWPTPLAILAWLGSPAQRAAQTRAVQFLVNTTGKHWERQPDAPVAHDTAIRGWPWGAGAHSWVEPTALSVIALRAAGHGNHPRVAEGMKMLLDRQLPSGGWSCSTSLVFGQELYPQPDATGLALQALAGEGSQKHVERSLAYLRSTVGNLKTPFTLGWGLLGLGAWDERPASAERLVFEILERQRWLGGGNVSHLSILLLAFFAQNGLKLS